VHIYVISTITILFLCWWTSVDTYPNVFCSWPWPSNIFLWGLSRHWNPREKERKGKGRRITWVRDWSYPPQLFLTASASAIVPLQRVAMATTSPAFTGNLKVSSSSLYRSTLIPTARAFSISYTHFTFTLHTKHWSTMKYSNLSLTHFKIYDVFITN
jgi:hypothetical protein